MKLTHMSEADFGEVFAESVDFAVSIARFAVPPQEVKWQWVVQIEL